MMRIAVCDDNADFLLSEITMIENGRSKAEYPWKFTVLITVIR